MKDFLKFNSDKSYVHEVTYLTDAKYYLKRHQTAKADNLLNSISKNKWYSSRGNDITKKVQEIYHKDYHNVNKMLHEIRLALNADE